MSTAAESKACIGCARAKRRCDKQRPSCRRCKNRNAECVYSSPQPSHVLAREADPDPKPPTSSADRAKVDELFDPSTSYGLVGADVNLNTEVPDPKGTGLLSSGAWFLSAETWKIDQSTWSIDNMLSFSTATSKAHMRILRSWFERWLTVGSSPFLHAHLYDFQFPSCAQVALAIFSSYTNRVESNEETILRIVEDQAKELLGSNGVDILADEHSDVVPPPRRLDPLEHIARVHALMVYQMITLFDGDIKSRYNAERRTPILERWAAEMVDCARRELGTLASVQDPLDIIKTGLPAPPALPNYTDTIWHAWILAESIRRTWLVANLVGNAFKVLQQGWGTCPGGMMFTLRQGAWDAETAFLWHRICSNIDVFFTQRFECSKYFIEASPSDIDEFGKIVLQITFGIERMERWNLGFSDV